jgi:hypothetical protein
MPATRIMAPSRIRRKTRCNQSWYLITHFTFNLTDSWFIAENKMYLLGCSMGSDQKIYIYRHGNIPFETHALYIQVICPKYWTSFHRINVAPLRVGNILYKFDWPLRTMPVSSRGHSRLIRNSFSLAYHNHRSISFETKLRMQLKQSLNNPRISYFYPSSKISAVIKSWRVINLMPCDKCRANEMTHYI